MWERGRRRFEEEGRRERSQVRVGPRKEMKAEAARRRLRERERGCDEGREGDK